MILVIPEGFIMSKEDAESKLKRGKLRAIYNFFTANDARDMFALDFGKKLTEIGGWLDHLYAQDTEPKNLEDVQKQWRGLIYHVINYLNERLGTYQPGSPCLTIIDKDKNKQTQPLNSEQVAGDIIADLKHLMQQTTDLDRGGWKSWLAAYAFLDARSNQLSQACIRKKLELFCQEGPEKITETNNKEPSNNDKEWEGTTHAYLDLKSNLLNTENTNNPKLTIREILTVLNRPKIENLKRLKKVIENYSDLINFARSCYNTKPFVNQIKSLIEQTKKLQKYIDEIIDYV